MEGKDKRAGAVACVSTIKNPISAARAVMEHSPHVLMSGRGAEAFAAERKLDIVDPSYFTTPERKRQLEKAIEEERKKEQKGQMSMGTVGAVAVDARGELAAATSTGGMTNKRFGRIGDSPIIGAGTYADNSACAVSCTGHGEIFIRFAVAHDVAARVKYKGESVRQAARAVLKGLPEEEGGVGGLIVIDAKGNCAMEFDTEGMYRGTITRDGKARVWIYKDEAGR
jgi:beta-aspartyl-peptidase (threonine type)